MPVPLTPTEGFIMKRAKKRSSKTSSRRTKSAGTRKIRRPRLSAVRRGKTTKKKAPLPPVSFSFQARETPVFQAPTPERFEAAPPVVHEHRMRELPDGYGDNQIYLLVRDPYWIYAYWEILGPIRQAALHELGGRWEDVKTVLRIYDVTDGGSAPDLWDIGLEGGGSNWYIQVRPNRSYVVEIGLLHRDGRFRALARSNGVTTPRDGMSDVLDEEWMGIDFDKMYALSGGFEVGKSSAELQRLMLERLRSAVTSGSGAGQISSPAKPPKAARDFRFLLDCELVVYGATEPNATVTIQGKKIRTRPDGTFTLRYALPDGKIAVDARAESSDGCEERVIIPIVERNTRKPDPVLKDKPAG